MNGFLNILKPPGMTSAGVVAFVRRLTGEKRVGHAGTLDPDACGILPVMVGRATRLFDYLVDKEKTYVAVCAFGTSTDTQDAGGVIIEKGTAYPALEQVKAAAASMIGDVWQTPGMYSAIKQNGKPMYELARKGETAEIPPRLVHIESIDIAGEEPDHGVLMTVCCGRGTYIRSICSDLGEKVGCPAHMRFLLRAQSGAFDLSTAHTLEELTEAAENGTLEDLLLPPDSALGHITAVYVPEWLEKAAANGMRLPVKKLRFEGEIAEGAAVRIYCGGTFRGMARREGDDLVWSALIAGND